MWRYSDKSLASWNLSSSQYNLLRILNGAGEPLAQAEIGRRMLASRASITKILDQLEVRGLVKRTAASDRRIKLIVITGKGLNLVEEVFPVFLGFQEKALERLTEKEQSALYHLIGKIANR